MGMCVPDRVVTSLRSYPTVWKPAMNGLFQRTGIRERRWVEGDVGATDLALPAAQEALTSGIQASDLDLIVFATLSPDINFPGY